jgi:anaerobic ribonucleoside-triphosphate reductase
MKIRELNRKIFHNASRTSQSDEVDMVSYCYEQVGESKERDREMEVCLGKWRATFRYLDSEEMLQAYAGFFRRMSS